MPIEAICTKTCFRKSQLFKEGAPLIVPDGEPIPKHFKAKHCPDVVSFVVEPKQVEAPAVVESIKEPVTVAARKQDAATKGVK